MKGEERRVSRRTFLSMLGLGTGLGVVGLGASGKDAGLQVKRIADPAGRPARPWWVKTVDQPTTEFEWSKIARFNACGGTVLGSGFASYVGEETASRLRRQKLEVTYRRIRHNDPGYTLKDHALNAAMDARPAISFLGPQMAPTPEERGVPRWTGTPEEAARIVRAAMRHMGAARVAFLELDSNTRKLIYSHDPDGKALVFTDGSIAYETAETRHIPAKGMYVIVFLVQMSEETFKTVPTVLGSQTTSLAYLRGCQIQSSTQEFIRALGYQALGGASINALGIAPAFGVLSGLGELSRCNRLISPEFGPMVRVFKMLTDLPVAVDKPIDAGILEFCTACKKCAEACPAGALSFDDEPTWDIRGGWNNAGHKAWFEDSAKCYSYWQEGAASDCGVCFAVCPFAKKDKAWVHAWMSAGIATLPEADWLYRSIDDALGYGGKKDCDEWWHLDLPEYGIDTTRSVRG